jgi:hypothetical protein
MKKPDKGEIHVPAADRDRLSRGLEDTPAVMVKWYLQRRGLPQYLGASKATINDRYLGHIARGELSLDDAYDGVREFYEFGAKEVRLFSAPAASIAHLPAALAEARVAALSQARIRRQPIATIANYSYLANGRLRFSFSEKHEDIILDRDAEEIVYRPRTNLVVVDGRAATGELYVALDPPRRRHPHGRGALDFYQYHLGRVTELLGVAPEALDLRHCIGQLEAADICEISSTEGKSDGCRVRFVANTTGDVRQDHAYQQFLGQRRTADSATVTWRPQPSNGRLTRPVKTKVEVRTSAVHFVQGTLEDEAAYVMEMIRANV